jgi:6-phosphogluconolactonase (cycloisomerase 2 family)
VIGPRFEVITRNGRLLYVADEVGSQLTAFARDPRTGQLGRRLTCLQEKALHGCRRLRVLQDAHALVLSPDGRFLYVAAATSDAILVLRRPGLRVVGCVKSGARQAGCRRARALDGSHNLALADRGRVLYGVGTNENAIAEFTRDRRSGALRQRPGALGCIGATTLHVCTRASGLAGVHHVAVVGPDVYAVSERGNAMVFLTDPTIARAARRSVPSP